jgi:hypothetical protein
MGGIFLPGDNTDYGADETVAAQSIDGLRCREPVYIFTDGQLDAIKKMSSIPFYYYPTNMGYVLYPSKVKVVNEKGKTVKVDYYLLAKRYAKKQRGVKKLHLELVDDDIETYCFDGWNNYESRFNDE